MATNKIKRRYVTVKVDCSADILLSDVLPEIESDELIRELKDRGEYGGELIFKDPMSLRNKIGEMIGLREWDYSNKERFMDRIAELF